MRKIKLILLFCAVFLSILLLTGDKDRIQADDDDSNFTNLVVFARFAGETEFINDVYEGSSVRKITDNSYNAGSYSVGDYYRCVSDNKLRMRSVYLYDNGGSIVLSHPRGYYAEYSDINTIGYKDASERASRMYELRSGQKLLIMPYHLVIKFLIIIILYTTTMVCLIKITMVLLIQLQLFIRIMGQVIYQ